MADPDLNLEQLLFELAKASEPIIDRLIEDIRDAINKGEDFPLRLLTEEQREAIAVLAAFDGDRLNDLQAELWALVPRARRHELNLEKYFAKKIAEKRRLAKTWARAGTAEANKNRGMHLPTPEVAIEAFNKRFVHTMAEPNDIVLDMESQTKWRPRAWASMFNDPVKVPGAAGDEIKPGGELWLQSAHRNRAEGGIVCDPSKAGGLLNSGGFKMFNTWRGLQVKPQQGDWSLIREFIQKGLCGGDEISFQHFLGDLARKLQFPHLHAETATVFLGAHGAGKGTLARILTRIFGIRHCMPTPQKGALIGDFNEHLRDLCVLIADEAFFAGDRASFSILRSIITEPYLSIHIKHGARQTVPSHLWVIVFSNDEHVVRTLGDRRRFHMPPMVEWHHNEDEYWTPVNQQIDNGGIEALVYDMLAFDLTSHKHRYPPITNILLAQEEFTRRHSLDTWLGDILQRGYPYETRYDLADELHVWPAEITRELARKSYAQWVADNRIGFHDTKSRHELYGYLRDPVKGPGLKDKRLVTGIIGEVQGEASTGRAVMADRPRGFELPDLHTMREDYDARLKLVTTWEPVPESQEVDQTAAGPDYSEEPDNE